MNVRQLRGCLDWSLRLPAFLLCGKSAGEMVLHSMGGEKNHAGSSQAIDPAFLLQGDPAWAWRLCTMVAYEGETRKSGLGPREKLSKPAEIRTPVSTAAYLRSCLYCSLSPSPSPCSSLLQTKKEKRNGSELGAVTRSSVVLLSPLGPHRVRRLSAEPQPLS